jgi:hypothetical protein
MSGPGNEGNLGLMPFLSALHKKYKQFFGVDIND